MGKSRRTADVSTLSPEIRSQLPDTSIAEQQILGAIIENENAFWGMAYDNLKPEYFSDPFYRSVFSAMCQSKAKDKDAYFTCETLKEFSPDLKGSDYVEIPTNVIQPLVPGYIRDLVEAQCKRILLSKPPTTDKDASELLQELGEKLEKTRLLGAPIQSLGQQTDALDNELLSEKIKPIPTFSTVLNKNFNGGLQRGKVYTFVAPAGGGKTTFALQLLQDIAVNGCLCVYVAMEMSTKELLIKTYSRLGQFNSGELEGESNKKKSLIEKAKNKKAKSLPEKHKYFDQMSANFYALEGKTIWTVNTIRNHVARISHEWSRGADPRDYNIVLCIDPFQRLSTGIDRIDGDTVAKVSKIASDMKDLARELQIPVVLLSDTTKASAQRAQEQKGIGQGGIAYSYFAVHTTDVLGEIRLGHGLPKQLGAEDKNQGIPNNYGYLSNIDVSENKYGPSATYACIDLSKQRSGSRARATFIYKKAFNEFEEIVPAKGDLSLSDDYEPAPF
jgi:replicative DNA helicase